MSRFQLTQDELNFVHHYCHEVMEGVQRSGPREAGPATKWLWDHGIFPTTMQPFQLALQRSHPNSFEVIDSPLPPFKPAWASKEEFEARAWEALETYPEMKGLGSALPGYRPADMGNKNPASVS